MEFIAQLLERLPEILMALLSIVGGFAYIATLTPNTADDRFWAFILKAINFLAANFGNAKNADPPNERLL